MHIPAFLRKISILLIGSGIAQILNFVFTSFLARLYLPEQFGSQAVFFTIAFYGTILFTGKYELALVIPKELKKAASIVRLSIILLLSFSALSIPIFYFFGDDIAQWLNQSELSPIAWLIPMAIIASGLISIFNYWHTRQENYKLLSGIRISETIVTGGVALAIFGVSTHGLIWGTLIGTSISALILFLFFRKDTGKINSERGEGVTADASQPLPTSESQLSIAAEYSDFPKNNIAISLINAFQFTGITLIISYFFGPVTAGYYALCNRILQAPFGLIIKPVSQIFFAEASSLVRNNKRVFEITWATIKRTALITFPVLVILILAGPFLFSFFFGDKWYISGFYAQILAAWFFLEFIKAPISQLAVIVRKQKQMLMINVISMAIFLTCAFLITPLTANPTVFLVYLSIFN